jgi:hypothetical protein
MKKLFLALLFLLFIPASFAACLNDDDRIFQISGTTNAHAEQWNQANYREPAGVEICYSDIFGAPYSGAPGEHECIIGTNTFLMGSGNATSLPTNMHVEQVGQGNYLIHKLCYGDLACNYRGSPGSPEPCQSGEECVVTISDVTNAHLATCSDPNAYDIKVCCSTGAGPSGLNADADGPYSCTLQELSETGGMACGFVMDGTGSSNSGALAWDLTPFPSCRYEGPTVVCQYNSDNTTGVDDIFVDKFGPTAQYGSNQHTFIYKNDAPGDTGHGETIFRVNELFAGASGLPPGKVTLALYHLESWVYGDSDWVGHPNEVRVEGHLILPNRTCSGTLPCVWQSSEEPTMSWNSKPPYTDYAAHPTYAKATGVISSASAENKCNKAFVPCDDLSGEHWVYIDITDVYDAWWAYLESEAPYDPENPGFGLIDIDGDYAHPSGLGEASGNKFASSENSDPSKRPKLIFSNGEELEFSWWITNDASDDDPECTILSGANTLNPLVSCTHVGTADAHLQLTDSYGSHQASTKINVTAPVGGPMGPSAEAYGPYFGDEGTAISLTGECFDSDGTISSCQWSSSSLPAGCSINQSPAGIGTATATNNGSVLCNGIPNSISFPIALTATDSDSLTGSDSTTVSVTDSLSGNMPPFAEADGPYSGASGNQVSLLGECFDSDGTVSSCVWSHDGGAACSVVQNPAGIGTDSATNNGSITCTFASDTTVTVTLTATDDAGDTGTDYSEAVITVAGPGNNAPNANAGPNQAVAPADPVSLTGLGSTDAEDCHAGGDCRPALSYSWACSGTSPDPCPALSNAASPAPGFTAGADGDTYDFVLTVTDSGSLSDSDTVRVSVSSAGPGPGTGFLKITQFTAEPVFFDIAAQKQFSSVKVVVKNTGTDTISSASVKLFAKATETNQPVGLNGLAASAAVSVNAGASYEFTFSNVDIVAAGGDLGSGSYNLVAESFDNALKTDSKNVYFTVGGASAIPEMPLALVAITALSVVLIALFSRKKS